jgi:hypothetical protein
MARRFVQFLLLLVLMLGVMGMHTLGHPSEEHHGGSSVLAFTHGPTSRLAAAPPCTPPLDPMDVCLAVLTAMGFASVLAALLTTGRRGSGTRVMAGGAWGVCGRGPPPGVRAIGRRLAILSVLRM